MEIKFTVPGPPKGQRDVASTSHMKEARAKSFLSALKSVVNCQRGLRADLFCRLYCVWRDCKAAGDSAGQVEFEIFQI